MSAFVAPARAAAHEALVARLQHLGRQAEAIAARRPEEAVGAAVVRIAADLLYEAQRFAPAAARRGLPMPAPDYAGLAAQLGQALAALEAFETEHTAWDAGRKGFVWRLGPTRTLPVARLRQPLAPPPSPAQGRDVRDKLLRQLQDREERRYEAGFAAGRAAALGGEEAAPATGTGAFPKSPD
jgi:hypothetical protein